MSEHWFEADPLWFKHAVFYEIHIRGFYDGNGDGSGDFAGLTEKLDYLQWLGIDCVWLLPMYASPLRDGGYDIADFFSIHPDYGTVEDFRRFVEEAHKRGMRVIADLVMNHTSSDHPWFQESRSAADGPKRDWYVWSDSDDRYPEARVIFVDTESSNWTWDNAAGAYYWLACIPMKQPFSSLQPCKVTLCPMVTSSPMISGAPGSSACFLWVTCSMVRSCTLLRAPIRMKLTSPLATQLYQMLLWGPIVTSPMITAVSATKAVSSMAGFIP
jgi:hypothetical protein